jgi:hypothetical protein
MHINEGDIESKGDIDQALWLAAGRSATDAISPGDQFWQDHSIRPLITAEPDWILIAISAGIRQDH